MRIECPHCETLIPAQIENLLPRAVRFQCGACHKSIELTDWAPTEEVATVPEGQRCPKCATPAGTQTAACRVCGLAMDRFEDFERHVQPVSEGLENAWSRLAMAWQDEQLHESFLEQVSLSAAYGEAALRYRAAAKNPEQRVEAEARLARIQRMATAALLSSRPKVASAEEPFRAVVMLLIALVLIAGAGGIYVMVRGKSHIKGPTYSPGRASPTGPSSGRASPAKSSPAGPDATRTTPKDTRGQR